MTDATCVRGDGRPVYVKRRGLCKPCYEADYHAGNLGEKVKSGPVAGQRTCSRDDCNEPHKAHGLCRNHLYEVQKSNVPPEKQCTFKGCDKPKSGRKDLCVGHWRQQRAGKALTPLRAHHARIGTCSGPECTLPVKETVNGVGYCSGHGFQARNGRELTVINRTNLKGGPCIVKGCPKTALTKDGVCRPHNRLRQAGDPDWRSYVVPSKAPNGAGHLDANGYVMVMDGGRKRGEHRVKMEQLLGHPLTRQQSVHHLSGNRSDNRTDGPLRLINGKLRSGNLELWSSSQPAGQEIGPKLEWALEMLEEYAPYLTDEFDQRLRKVLEGRALARMMEQSASFHRAKWPNRE